MFPAVPSIQVRLGVVRVQRQGTKKRVMVVDTLLRAFSVFSLR